MGAGQKRTAGAGAFSALTPAQARAVDAMTSRILPSVDGRPGAHEAGVVYFIDTSLATFNAAQKTLYADGVADLEPARRAQLERRGELRGADAGAAGRDAPRRSRRRRSSRPSRFDTIVGTFALPTWGGNRDYAGWHMLGFEHQPRVPGAVRLLRRRRQQERLTMTQTQRGQRVIRRATSSTS